MRKKCSRIMVYSGFGLIVIGVSLKCGLIGFCFSLGGCLIMAAVIELCAKLEKEGKI